MYWGEIIIRHTGRRSTSYHSAEIVLCFRNHVLFPCCCFPVFLLFSEYQQWAKRTCLWCKTGPVVCYPQSLLVVKVFPFSLYLNVFCVGGCVDDSWAAFVQWRSGSNPIKSILPGIWNNKKGWSWVAGAGQPCWVPSPHLVSTSPPGMKKPNNSYSLLSEYATLI